MGCELGQGYHFAYPGTPEQLWSAVHGSPNGASNDGPVFPDTSL
jgi:hypothetical protein